MSSYFRAMEHTLENINNNVSLSSMIILLDNSEAAEKVLNLMREKDPSVLVLCNEEHPTEALNDAVCQYIAEQGLKEILDIIKSKPIVEEHLFAGAVLVSIKDIHLVKKYIWKDQDFIPALTRLLKHKINEEHCEDIVTEGETIDDRSKMYIDVVACIIQGVILGGTPKSFFEAIAKSEIIDLYKAVFEKRLDVYFKQSFEKLILSLLVICQNNESCLRKCGAVEITKTLEEFEPWEKLDEDIREKIHIACQCIEHMAHQDQLPDYKKVILNKFSDHMHSSNKTYKRMETVKCSFSECAKKQPDTKEGRFKKCGRCHVVLYCSKECQKAHWVRGHQDMCVAPAGNK